MAISLVPVQFTVTVKASDAEAQAGRPSREKGMK